MKICPFYDTEQGCTFGDVCRNWHLRESMRDLVKSARSKDRYAFTMVCAMAVIGKCEVSGCLYVHPRDDIRHHKSDIVISDELLESTRKLTEQIEYAKQELEVEKKKRYALESSEESNGRYINRLRFERDNLNMRIRTLEKEKEKELDKTFTKKIKIEEVEPQPRHIEKDFIPLSGSLCPPPLSVLVSRSEKTDKNTNINKRKRYFDSHERTHV
jgi:hypothetical protein